MSHDLDTIINRLIDIRADHGNLPCFHGDMRNLMVDTFIGECNLDSDTYPEGFVHFGEW